MVAVFEAHLAVNEGLSSGLAISKPEQHAFAIQVLCPGMGDVTEVNRTMTTNRAIRNGISCDMAYPNPTNEMIFELRLASLSYDSDLLGSA